MHTLGVDHDTDDRSHLYGGYRDHETPMGTWCAKLVSRNLNHDNISV